jgi:DNA repair exonuclease SbcCD ATPase subunit
MIPQRIGVRGFLCYREEQEVHFDAASLWLLAGSNGSGKSAVFDAVTYALFGGHRGGQYGAAALINKDCDGLTVELDFLLENKLFQARRTLKRSNKGTGAGTQLIRCWRPSGAGEENGCWEPVPDTSNKAGFDRWIRENIGLTYETFTSSVLLVQGKTEKLLAAAPRDRFEVLADIVGLERYQRLHKKADDRRRALQAQTETLQQQLRGVPAVDVAELREADDRIQAAEAALAEAETEAERLQSLSLALPLLRRLHRERDTMRGAGEAVRQAAEAEEAAAAKVQRLESDAVPLLTQLEAAREDLRAAEQRVTRTNTLLQEVRKRLERFQSVRGETNCRYCGQPLTAAHVQAEQAKLEEEQAAAEHASCDALAPWESASREAERLQRQANEVEGRLNGARQEVAQWRSRQVTAQHEFQRCGQECSQVYQDLPEPFRSRVSPETPPDWCATRFPEPDDLTALQRALAGFQPDRVKRRAAELRQARQAHYELVYRQEMRQQLEAKCLEVDRQHKLAALLAELLGRQRLQLHLVRRAERGIVAYANAVLDRLSGGQLYLRLGGEDNGEGSDRALELEAYNRAAGATPVGVAFLSGSQRFRVAVSLALGIGQYASRRHRPLESVIIDEGFGCLDREGRQVMIQELHNLKGQLRCILVVSHQEEFADAFPDGYRFELIEGTAVATRFSA